MRPGYKRDVAERCSAKGGNHAAARDAAAPSLYAPGGRYPAAKGGELLQIVFGIEILFVERSLANNAIEEIAALRHPPAGGGGGIAWDRSTYPVLINGGSKSLEPLLPDR